MFSAAIDARGQRNARTKTTIALTMPRETRTEFSEATGGWERREPSQPGVEFLRRFLLHILPKGFVRIRHYGFLANRCRQAKLARCRELLDARVPEALSATDGETSKSDDGRPCPSCRTGLMAILWMFDPGDHPREPAIADSS